MDDGSLQSKIAALLCEQNGDTEIDEASMWDTEAYDITQLVHAHIQSKREVIHQAMLDHLEDGMSSDFPITIAWPDRHSVVGELVAIVLGRAT